MDLDGLRGKKERSRMVKKPEESGDKMDKDLFRAEDQNLAEEGIFRSKNSKRSKCRGSASNCFLPPESLGGAR